MRIEFCDDDGVFSFFFRADRSSDRTCLLFLLVIGTNAAWAVEAIRNAWRRRHCLLVCTPGMAVLGVVNVFVLA